MNGIKRWVVSVAEGVTSAKQIDGRIGGCSNHSWDEMIRLFNFSGGITGRMVSPDLIILFYQLVISEGDSHSADRLIMSPL